MEPNTLAILVSPLALVGGQQGRYKAAMSRCLRFLAVLGGVPLVLALRGPVSAAESALSARPDLIPADVPVADLGQSTALAASIPYDPSLGTAPVFASGPPPLPAPDQVGGLHYPLARPAQGLDPWGWRYSESRGRWRMHTGIDLMAPRGTPVLAALPGRVHLVQWIDGYGLTLVLDHADGRRTLYAHLDSVAVRPAQVVRAGEPVAVVGMTGRTSGPHLHFELRSLEGGAWVARDPLPLLPDARISPLLAVERQRLAEGAEASVASAPFLLPPPALPPLLASDASLSGL